MESRKCQGETTGCAREESNLHLVVRSHQLYPLSYGRVIFTLRILRLSSKATGAYMSFLKVQANYLSKFTLRVSRPAKAGDFRLKLRAHNFQTKCLEAKI